MRIQLVLADDWELRGDGSGNMRAIQFRTIRRLCEIYETSGLRGSFNAEVMQQLAHLERAEKHPELAELAREWEEVVGEVYRRGHDVQLHLHPQWTDANYEAGHWDLRGPWSILDYRPEDVERMIERGKAYLENLLRPANPAYQCVSFRSGSWCIAPGPHVLRALAKAGIVFDMSIVDGLFYETRHVSLDYRSIDEPFLPYYPRPEDARRLARNPQPIVCIPTHSFRDGKGPLVQRVLARAVRRRASSARWLERFIAPSDVAIPDSGYTRAYAEANWQNVGGTATASSRVSDLSALSFGQMRWMLRDIRRRARASGWEAVPVVLENHTKDIGNFVPLERFAAEVASASDLDVLTLTEVAQNLARGAYPVRSAVGS